MSTIEQEVLALLEELTEVRAREAMMRENLRIAVDEREAVERRAAERLWPRAVKYGTVNVLVGNTLVVIVKRADGTTVSFTRGNELAESR